MSTTPPNPISPANTAAPKPVAAVAKTPAPARAAATKPSRRRASVVPSEAVIAKAAAPVKAAIKTSVVKTLALNAPLVKVAVKAAVKKPTAARPAIKAVAKLATQPIKAAAPAVKPKTSKKPKLVRDSFTIPKAEYVVLDELKQRAAKLALPVKKSELLRAGIKALAAMSDTVFRAALKDVPAIKTGRPASDK